MPAPRRDPAAPLDPPMVPFALAGTVLWAVAGLVLLAADAPTRWLWTCLAGALLGGAGLIMMVIRDRRRRQPARPADQGVTSSTSVSS